LSRDLLNTVRADTELTGGFTVIAGDVWLAIAEVLQVECLVPEARSAEESNGRPGEAGHSAVGRLFGMEGVKDSAWIPRCDSQQCLGRSFRFSSPLFPIL